jgi:outer membrane protein W
MKKVFLLPALFFLMLSAQAQDFKPFQLYLGLGYAMPSNGGGGILVNLEPAYRINDKIAAGFRIESAAMARVVGEQEAKIAGVGSYTVNGKYYLSNNNFRPYAGVGLGLYSLASVEVQTAGAGSAGVAAGTAFGFYPRIGFDAGHFNFNIDYNIIGSTQLEVTTDGADKIQNSYIGFRIGAFIFGGRR